MYSWDGCELFRNSRRSYRFPRDRLPAAARPFFFFTPPLPKGHGYGLLSSMSNLPCRNTLFSAVRFAVVLLENVFAVECVTLDLCYP